ncbi:uncharacterized protein LOC141526653 [Cotesia typhae]|uniref:uncharacterized protein LOC141526653 n=1 Tax=Cotesia typhae TaxID=2053667 RepID=UPI003D693E31
METPGQRVHSRRLHYGRFTYHLDSRYATKARKRYLCASRITATHCPVKLWKNADGAIEVIGEHNHPESDIENREPIIRMLQNQAVADDLLPQEVINTILRNIPNAANYSNQASRQVIHRQRRRYRPPLPENFADLGQMLLGYRRIMNINRHQVIAEDGSIAYIFGSDEMLQRLAIVSEWHVDGTFQCVPQRPRALQLFMIHMRRMDIGIPVLYILCSHRTIPMYNGIFNWILNQVPEIRQNLQTIVSDFEVAILRSVEICMPWVNRRGCWFHFVRAVTRKWNALRLPAHDAPEHRILNLTWTLQLVPANRFTEALDVIIDQLLPLENMDDNYYLFRRYLQRYWLPLANIVSVYNSPWRTNNISEVFNRHLLSNLGPHPNLFRFLHRLIELINEDKNLFNALENGVDLGRNRRHRQYNTDRYITGIQEALETGRFK